MLFWRFNGDWPLALRELRRRIPSMPAAASRLLPARLDGRLPGSVPGAALPTGRAGHCYQDATASGAAGWWNRLKRLALLYMSSVQHVVYSKMLRPDMARTRRPRLRREAWCQPSRVRAVLGSQGLSYERATPSIRVRKRTRRHPCLRKPARGGKNRSTSRRW